MASARRCGRFADRLTRGGRTAFGAYAVLTIYDYELGEPVAGGTVGGDDRMHFGLQAVAHQSRSHNDWRHRADWTEGTGAMFSDLQAHDLTIVNRRWVVLNRLVGEHQPYLVIAGRAVSVDGFHCSPPVVRGELSQRGLLALLSQVNGITSASRSSRCAITIAGSCGNPKTDVEAASASIARRASTVALWNGVFRGAAVSGSIR